MKLHGRSLIGFSRGAEGGDTWRVENPATGKFLEPVYQACSEDEWKRAVDLAAKAAREFGDFPGERRAAFIREVALGLEEQETTLAERIPQETALDEVRVKVELGRTAAQLRMFADEAESGEWLDVRVDHGEKELRSMNRPLGPVAVFCAANFPLAYSVAGGDTASALAAGCPVIVVAHWAHPGSAEIVGRVVQQAAESTGMPEGVFSLLYGKGQEMAQALVQHPKVKGVGFTGSRQGGLAIMKLATDRKVQIPVFAEMSSSNPVFLLPGALDERGHEIVQGLVKSVTDGMGQFCTKPGLIICLEKYRKEFAASLAESIAEVPAGVMLNASIRENYLRCTQEVASCAESILLPEREGLHVTGGVFSVTETEFYQHEVLAEEMFGPATIVIGCAGREAMLCLAESLGGQLTATIHASSQEKEWRASLVNELKLKVGRLIHDGYPTGLQVGNATVHSGAFPATSDGRSTAVGARAIHRWGRLVCWQDCPEDELPRELRK